MSPGVPDQTIGVYASITPSSYLIPDNRTFPEQPDVPFFFSTSWIGNDKDYAVSRVAYRLDLKGLSASKAPARLTVRCGDGLPLCWITICDMALKYRWGIDFPAGKLGYLADRVARFHAMPAAMPSITGPPDDNGAGVVLLKRPARRRRLIYGVVRGFAVNNDGATRSDLRPERAGAGAVLGRRWSCPESGRNVTFIETYGTGTPMGDPMEARALESVY